jgi:C1A family cysteine protease
MWFAVVAVCAAASLSGGAVVGATPDSSARAPAGTVVRSSTPAADAPPWRLVGPYAAAYDLRTVGKVTPVRQQENYSTCWIQSAMASLESCLLPQTLYDFSENNLANHMASRLIYEGHGDNRLATAYFARWEGPVLERSDPYPRKGRSPEGLRAVLHVQDVLFLPVRTAPLDNDAVKWAVSTLGAVSGAMAFQSEYMNPESYSYYSSAPGLFLGHYVTCVGWDDDYPAEEFAESPPGDGAFLIKNSWGTDWGDAGYFWISYYDANFGQDMAVYSGAESASDYDAIYQHDALGWSKSLGLGGESAWFAARYRCAGSGHVAAVSFYTPVPGSTFEVRVASTLEGLAAAPEAARGTALVAGYHTVKLTAPAAVQDGEAFVAAVRLTTPGSTEPVPLEHPSQLIAPISAPGRSFVSADGTAWTDLTKMAGYQRSDVCLKAFVDSADGGGDVRPPVVSVRDAVVTSGGRARVRYHLGDPAFSCASATVTLALRTAAGATAASVRLPAVQAGDAGEWSFSCDLPAGVYKVVGMAYDVAGNRQKTAAAAKLRVKGSAGARSVTARH